MTEYLQLTDGTRWRVAGGIQIDTEMETFRVQNSRHPQTAWIHTDSHGHTHKYFRDEEGVPRLPSLEARRRQVECDGSCDSSDCDGYTVEEWFCRECGEEVEPGFRVVHDETIPYASISTYTVEVEAEPTDAPIEGALYAYADADGTVTTHPLPTLHSVAATSSGSRTVTKTSRHRVEER